MSGMDADKSNRKPQFIKLLQIAYNLASDGYYERANQLASAATDHYEDTFETN